MIVERLTSLFVPIYYRYLKSGHLHFNTINIFAKVKRFCDLNIFLVEMGLQGYSEHHQKLQQHHKGLRGFRPFPEMFRSTK